MFTIDLVQFKTEQQELHRQAEYQRVLRSLEEPNPVVSRIINALGRMLIQTGQQLLRRTQAVH